jgi:hypothetical protein
MAYYLRRQFVSRDNVEDTEYHFRLTPRHLLSLSTSPRTLPWYAQNTHHVRDDLSRTKSHHNHHAQYLGDLEYHAFLALRQCDKAVLLSRTFYPNSRQRPTQSVIPIPRGSAITSWASKGPRYCIPFWKRHEMPNYNLTRLRTFAGTLS